jgi:hypothetical protein
MLVDNAKNTAQVDQLGPIEMKGFHSCPAGGRASKD